MTDAVRDGNQVTALQATYNGSPIALLADHATGYLKAKIVNTTLSVPSVSLTTAARDGNQVRSELASYNGAAITLMADHATGYLKAVI